MLAFVTPALGQAVPPPAQLPPTPPASDSDATLPAIPGTTPRPSIALPPAPQSTTGSQPPANTFAQSNAPPVDTGLLAYSLASVPDMMGEMSNRGHYRIMLGLTTAHDATIPIAGGDGYAKIADDTSPIPTDRVFFDYNYFNHSVGTANDATIGLNRFNFGVEKTFFGGCCSIEVQAPVETGLNDTQTFDDTTAANQGTAFGNMSLTLKCLVYQCNCFAASVGTMVDLPTAPNGSFTNGNQTLTFRNDSVHVAPFVGFAYAPCYSGFFATGFVQVDVDANGDPVHQTFAGSNLDIERGRFRDPSLLYLDLAMGYWLFRDEPCYCGRYLTGIAPTVELHYTTTLQDYRGIDDTVVPIYGGTDCLDLTAGVHFQMGPCSMLTVGGVVPLRNTQRDKDFDSEALVQFDRRF